MPIDKEFAQSYYTSCRNGLSRQPGFQTKAISGGRIQTDTRQLIEAFVSGYHLPAGRDRNCEEGQPVTLKSFSLGEGLWCVSLTQYRKFDWTGQRIGNFFAHSLVCSRKDFLDFGANPFRVYYSGYFKNEDAGDTMELPPLMVSLPEIPIKASMDGLREKVGGETRLRQMTDAFLSSVSANPNRPERPVIIVADPADVLAILEGMITILPLSIRARISFSSYEASKPPNRIDNPPIPGATNLMACSGATGLSKSGQAYSDIDFDYSYLIFDFEGDRFSNVPLSTRFSDWISRKIFGPDDKAVEECLDFLSLYDLTNENLDNALAFYLLPGSVRSLNNNQMRAVLEFAQSESKTVKQAEASCEKLLVVLEEAVHELDLIVALLRIAARYNLEGALQKVYPRFLRLLIDKAKGGDQRTFSVLSDAAPARWQAQLAVELVQARAPGGYSLGFVLSALDKGASALSQDQETVLFKALVQLLNDALERGNTRLTEEILSKVRQKEKQVLLACEIKSSKGVPAQVLLIKNALGLLREALSGSAERLGQRAADLFEAAVREWRLADACLVLSDVLPLLPPLQRRAFILRCLDEKLNSLWQILGREARQLEALGIASQWLRLLLEDEFVSELELCDSQEELRRQLASKNIHVEEIYEIQEEKRGQKTSIPVRDSRNNNYVVKQAGNRLQVWRLNPSCYIDRLKGILEAFLKFPKSAPERDVIWNIVVDELDRRRIGSDPPDLLLQLCKAVIQRPVSERLRIIRNYLSPLLAEVADKKEHLRILLGNVLSSAQTGDFSASDLKELLRQLKVSVDDVRGIYSGGGNEALFEFYWDRLGSGKDWPRIMNELEVLYPSGNFGLFERLVRQAIDSQRKERAAFVRELLTKLPSLLDDSPRFNLILEACRRVPGDAWPKFVSQVYAFLRDAGSERGVAVLAKQCVERLRYLIGSDEQITRFENEVLDHWLNSAPPESEQMDVDAVWVFREVKELRCDGPNLQDLLSTKLRVFQSRKNDLAQQDYDVAASVILKKFAYSRNIASSDNWDCVEEVARRNLGCQPVDEFSKLIELFFSVRASRRDYPPLLAHVTLKWIYNWDNYMEYRRVLRSGYSLLKDREKKEDYEELVLNELDRMTPGKKAEEGARWWKDMIRQLEKKGIFSRFFGRLIDR